MGKNGLVTIGVAAAVAAMLWPMWSRKVEQPPTPTSSITGAVAEPAPLPPSLVAADAKDAAVPVAPASSPRAVNRQFLFGQLTSATNAMAFAMNAKGHPDAGGYYYAVTVSRECLLYSKQREHSFGNGGAVPYDAGVDQKVVQQRQRALEEADRYCQGFGVDSYSEYLSPTVTNEGRRLKDPLLLARTALAGADVADRKAAIENAMAFGDPYLLFSNPELFFSGNSGGATYFDGQWQQQRASQLFTAAQLAACDLGMPCGSGLLLLKRKCAIESDCYGSFEEQVRNTWSAEEMGFINAARAKIASAYQSRDPGLFLPAGK